MNGDVEAANKNINKSIQRRTITYNLGNPLLLWHEMLPFALHGYRTTARTSTGATPFSLVYGMEVVLPIEVQIPSLRIIKDADLNEDDWIQTRLDQLNLSMKRDLLLFVMVRHIKSEWSRILTRKSNVKIGRAHV